MYWPLAVMRAAAAKSVGAQTPRSNAGMVAMVRRRAAACHPAATVAMVERVAMPVKTTAAMETMAMAARTGRGWAHR